jgi:hypothetical protein
MNRAAIQRSFTMWMSTNTIKAFRPGRVLDGHVHDVLGVPEPVWPYSTHPRARERLREWLKMQKAQIWLAGEARASDDCAVSVRGFHESFNAVSENHALCLAVLLAHNTVSWRQACVTPGRLLC